MLTKQHMLFTSSDQRNSTIIAIINNVNTYYTIITMTRDSAHVQFHMFALFMTTDDVTWWRKYQSSSYICYHIVVEIEGAIL